MNENVPPKAPDNDPARRSFLMRFAAVVCGGIVALFPFAVGWGVIVDPWRRSRKTASTNGSTGATEQSNVKLVPICPLDALPADGIPRPFVVTTDVVDSWTHTPNQRIGIIYLERSKAGDPPVVAFSAACPHLGCFIEFNSEKAQFECPCHKSAFDKDGKKLFGPSRRGLDQLTVKLNGTSEQTEIFVAFQKFQAGIEERKPAE